ncbi:MAG: DegT/DnrJ/EryC1/StrS family aminotransferase [Bacillota bacterium]
MIPIAKPLVGEKEQNAVMALLESGQLASGERVNQFETAFADFVGAKYAVATSSGTTALHLALLAAGVQPGDKVITTPFTFAATANAILYCGAMPVFVDIDPVTLNIDPQAVEQAARMPGVKALLVVHLYGTPCQMDALTTIASDMGLLLIEDCAQAHGAKFCGRHVGNFGEAGAFSFYATKNMTTGEGGMVVTNRKDIYHSLKLLVNHGSPSKYRHEILGYNYRLTEVAAAIGLVQLQKLPLWTKQRQDNARYLTQGLQQLSNLVLPQEPPDCECVYHQYTVRTKRRDALVHHLRERGVGTAVHYPIPVHQQPLYQKLGFGDSRLPVAEAMAEQVLSLPVHPALKNEELQHIVEALRIFFEKL